MRFGLSDLEELPSLKEFEALAREALGSDEGLAPVDESLTNEASIGATSEASRGHEHSNPSEAIEHVATELAEAEAEREEHAAATSEGMPSGKLDEDPLPPGNKAAAAGE